MHKIKVLLENICYDDQYELNTQSGTQWDGFRHVSRLYRRGRLFRTGHHQLLTGSTLTHTYLVRTRANANVLQRGKYLLLILFNVKSGKQLTQNLSRPRDRTSSAPPPTTNVASTTGLTTESPAAASSSTTGVTPKPTASDTTHINRTASHSRISRNAARPRGSTSGPRRRAATSKSAISYSSARDSWNDTTN